MSNEDRAAEAAGVERTVKFRDNEFTIPEYADWPLELHEALGDDKPGVIVLRAALGEDQWAVVRSMKLTTPGIDELAEAVFATFGLGSSGNSAASSD